MTNLNSMWAELIIEELIRNGVDYFCIAPGSRSAPLTIAAARNKRAKTFVHFDERGLAFHALGYTSATRKPCVLICTSGTAVGNFFPAIIEASKKKLPLIVLTADRPPELQKTGANQTIEQNNIFGKYAKWTFEFPCPTPEIKPEFVLTTIDQAVFQAKSGMKGVVHLNCMFREPLTPKKTEKRIAYSVERLGPYTTYEKLDAIRYTLDAKTLDAIKSIKNGLIVVGKIPLSGSHAQAVLHLAEKLQFPIFPDVTSGLRLGIDHPNLIHYYDLLLAENKLKNFKPDGIIHLGGRITSSRYYEFIKSLSPKTLKSYITVISHPLRNDPLHIVTHRIQSCVGQFCMTVNEKIPSRPQSAQLLSLKKLSESTNSKLTKLENSKTLSEEAVARLISRLILKNSGLFLSSSLPVRHMDTYAAYDGNPVIVGSNRGASGIDGTIASAIGFAKGLNNPTTLLIGDLAFLHDLNSLAMLKDLKVPLTIVVLNNNGGGIFHKLPVSQVKDAFIKYFKTPHNLNFKQIGNVFNLENYAVKSMKDFARAYKNKGKKIIVCNGC